MEDAILHNQSDSLPTTESHIYKISCQDPTNTFLHGPDKSTYKEHLNVKHHQQHYAASSIAFAASASQAAAETESATASGHRDSESSDQSRLRSGPQRSLKRPIARGHLGPIGGPVRGRFPPEVCGRHDKRTRGLLERHTVVAPYEPGFLLRWWVIQRALRAFSVARNQDSDYSACAKRQPYRTKRETLDIVFGVA